MIETAALSPALMADAILVIHSLFILGVILPVPLIAIGGLRRWQWVRNPWLRAVHLGMIAFVAAESLLGFFCPLTVWENNLRQGAGESVYGDSFIAYWLHQAFFFDFPSWVFTLAYCLFGLLILALYILVPPGRFRRER